MAASHDQYRGWGDVRRQTTPAPGGLTDKGTKGERARRVPVHVHVLRRIAGHWSLTTTQRYLQPDVHKTTAAGPALSAHFSVLRAPRSLPGLIVMAH
ncbi:hypothetical protein [Streptomyces sp. NPDC002172]